MACEHSLLAGITTLSLKQQCMTLGKFVSPCSSQIRQARRLCDNFMSLLKLATPAVAKSCVYKPGSTRAVAEYGPKVSRIAEMCT